MTRRVEAGPVLVTLGAVLLLVSLFLDWFEPGITAWQAFEVWDLVLFVLAIGSIAAGLGLAVPDVDLFDRRWLPAMVAAVAVIAASQIVDPPPAAAGQDPELGAWLALASALVMCVGGVLTFGRVRLALTVESRDPRRHVSAVDARRPPDPTTESNEPITPAGATAGDAHERLFARAETDSTEPLEGAAAAGERPREEKQD